MASTSGDRTGEGVTARLVEACRRVRYDDLPPDVVFVAKQCLLDWLGVTLAGSRQPLAVMLREEIAEEGGRPAATILGDGARVSVRQAALANGAASHALDYDDVHMAMSGHPTVPVAPALLALAEQRCASGRDVIAAFVAGIEMECRVGMMVMPGHYQVGFHATGTLGTFGAAAACAHLLGLDADQWRQALGIAGAQAAGLKAMFGTMCKPLHAGKAAANGLLAATLAARGFTSNPDVFEAAQGFAATQTATFSPERALAGLGEGFAVRDVLFKYHAACYGTHETIEGLARLRERHGIGPGDVEAVRLEVPPGHLAMCNIAEPGTALEGKFSLRFTAALALAGGDTTESGFTDERVHEPALVALRDRVTVAARAGEAGALSAGTAIAVRLRDGRELREWVNLDEPAADLQMQWERLATKFRSLAGAVVGGKRAEEILATVARLDKVTDVSALMASCVAGVAV